MPLLRVAIALALLAAIVFALVATGVRLAFDYKDRLVANSFTITEPQTDRQTVEAGDAQAVDVEVFEAFGELELHGGAPSLMQAEFTYNVQELRPEVHYTVDDGQGKLVVQHPDVDDVSRMLNIGSYRSRWNLAFNDSLPLHLEIAFGAGESKLDLSGLLLTGGEIAGGAGTMTIDLSGPWRQGFNLEVNGGVGETTLLLPATTGVLVRVEHGIGDVMASGLTQTEEDAYVNAAYGHSDQEIEIDVNAGIGQVNLQLAE